eukprot:5079613-Prymnesium_polylepis.1
MLSSYSSLMYTSSEPEHSADLAGAFPSRTAKIGKAKGRPTSTKSTVTRRSCDICEGQRWSEGRNSSERARSARGTAWTSLRCDDRRIAPAGAPALRAAQSRRTSGRAAAGRLRGAPGVRASALEAPESSVRTCASSSLGV